MPSRVLCLAILWSLLAEMAAAQQRPKPLLEDLKNPASVAVGTDGRVLIAVRGDDKKDGGAILALRDGKAVPLVTGLDDPKGLAVFQQWLFAIDRDRVLRIDRQGKTTILAGPKAFPTPPQTLLDVAIDEYGNLYVCDGGEAGKKTGAIYRITPQGKAALVTDSRRTPELQEPVALLMDSTSHLLVLTRSGNLLRVAVNGGKAERVGAQAGSGGLARDYHGRLFLTQANEGKLLAVPRPGEKPVLLARDLGSAVDVCVDPAGKHVYVVDGKKGSLTALPATIPGWEVDETPIALEPAVAFPDLQWTGWKGETMGKLRPLRPIVLTHAGDGSNRVFVATQHGVIHVFRNDQQVKPTKIFLDLSARVRYSDNANEEGFLGLAFHPKYRQNGEFFVFYTERKATLTNVVTRFRVSKDDPNRADPVSEEEVLRVRRPFWNHDGGTICFGPDGFLYVALGDGGAANDPFDNGQNLKTLLGTVLRIDIDRKDEGKAYAIPKDNPFVKRKDARPEIFAYGLRNVWRMAFDRPTGDLWAADVGQNLWEEINLLKSGGNYGWNRREGLHPFGAKGVGPNKDMIDPLWEYHHDIGKSITGGLVYRGKRLKELEGAYVYADYVTGRIWALRYDKEKGRVVANRPLGTRGQPILSFGEDEKGEIYFLTVTLNGQGISRFVPSRSSTRKD